METHDYQSDLWTIRAAQVHNVLDETTGVRGDFWLWFVARRGEDIWMAHGVSSERLDEMLEACLAAIEGGDMDVFLSYMGEPWATMEPHLWQHAQMQRDLAGKLYAASGEMNRLLAMTSAEILAERRAHEIAVETRQDINDN